MLTVVNRNVDLGYTVVKNHHNGVVFGYQIHGENKSNPVVETFKTKREADEWIRKVPVAPVIETKAEKMYSQYTGSSHK